MKKACATGCGMEAPPEMKVWTVFMREGSPLRARRLYIGGTMMAMVTSYFTMVLMISDGVRERRMTMVEWA